MKFGELDINVKDYLGRIGPGVTVVLSVLYKTKVYEAMYWYTDDVKLIQIPEEIEGEIGKIEEFSEYDNIISHLTEITGEYTEIAPQLEDLFEETENGENRNEKPKGQDS